MSEGATTDITKTEHDQINIVYIMSQGATTDITQT